MIIKEPYFYHHHRYLYHYHCPIYYYHSISLPSFLYSVHLFTSIYVRFRKEKVQVLWVDQQEGQMRGMD